MLSSAHKIENVQVVENSQFGFRENDESMVKNE